MEFYVWIYECIHFRVMYFDCKAFSSKRCFSEISTPHILVCKWFWRNIYFILLCRKKYSQKFLEGYTYINILRKVSLLTMLPLFYQISGELFFYFHEKHLSPLKILMLPFFLWEIFHHRSHHHCPRSTDTWSYMVFTERCQSMV